MAVCRGGIAFWVGCIRSHGNRQPVRQQCWSLAQVQVRGLSRASWALLPPNGLRYQNARPPTLSHPFHHASQPQRTPGPEDEWDDAASAPGESDSRRALAEVPLFGQASAGEPLASGAGRPVELLFPLTTVDGSREDDISVGQSEEAPRTIHGERERRERGSFRSLFEAEGCPAPFMCGSRFYCFHCPETEPLPGDGGKPGRLIGREGGGHVDLALLLPSALCGYAAREGEEKDGQSEGEEKLALVYEKLRIELPSFFAKSHDYTMYSRDVEFINGLLNMTTRGRGLYQLSLSLWRLVCLCYYAEARVEVLKLTKRAEDGSVEARWRIMGLPFHSLLLRFYKKDKTCLYRSYDAFSTFYMGQDGLIHRHKVEKVMQARPPVLPRVGSLLAGALVALGVQDHRPALNLLPLLLSSRRQGRH